MLKNFGDSPPPSAAIFRKSRPWTTTERLRLGLLGAHAAAAMLAAGAALTSPELAAAQNNPVQSEIPAFYQHQGDNDTGGKPTSSTKSTNGIWAPDKGWCAYVSYLDALYPWETVTVAGVKLFDNNADWLFGAVGPAGNPGVGTSLTSPGSWLNAADDIAIPRLVSAGTLVTYLKRQKVDPASLGLFGLVDTQYRTQPSGQVQVWTIDGWKDVTPNTFQLYQQLTSAGSKLPVALQPLAAITTTIRINYTGGNTKASTGFWWSFHQVAGAGVAGADTIRYSDPDAIPINAEANGVAAASSRNGGFTQAAVNANEYKSAAFPNQPAGAPPLPGNTFAGGPGTTVGYTTNNLYSTMEVNAAGKVIGGNGPYAKGLLAAAAPVTRITNIEAISLPAVQIAGIIIKPLYDAVKFLFSGNFGGDVTKLEIFANSPLYAANLGLGDTDPGWGVAHVMTDPFGNSWAATDGGILLTKGGGGLDLMEDGADYAATEDTKGVVTAWTVFAYDQADGYWLTETYGAGAAFGAGPQAVPEASTSLMILIGAGGAGLIALLRRRTLAAALA
jgi:hypothetical protein